MEQQSTASPVVNKILVQKRPSVWRLKFALGFLTLLLILFVAGGGFAAIKGYVYYKDKNTQVANLNDEVGKLKSQQNLNIVDLQKQIDDLKGKNSDYIAQNGRLTNDLNAANNKITQLSPKDIRDLKYDTLININKANGDAWLNPIYADVTGDGKADGIFSYKLGGAGNFLNIYVYTYIDNGLVQILKAEEYPKGSVAVLPDSAVEIKYQSGSPDSPTQSTSVYKWDGGAKKLLKV